MELRDTPEEAAFRQEVREFIAANLPDGSAKRGARRFQDDDRAWSQKLGEAGYAGLTWPKEYGGAGAPYSHQAIYLEELARASRTRATTSSSTARRCGRRSRTSRTSASSSARACPTRRSTRTSPT